MNGMRLIDKDAAILAVDTFNAERKTEMTVEDADLILWEMDEIDPDTQPEVAIVENAE